MIKPSRFASALRFDIGLRHVRLRSKRIGIAQNSTSVYAGIRQNVCGYPFPLAKHSNEQMDGIDRRVS